MSLQQKSKVFYFSLARSSISLTAFIILHLHVKSGSRSEVKQKGHLFFFSAIPGTVRHGFPSKTTTAAWLSLPVGGAKGKHSRNAAWFSRTQCSKTPVTSGLLSSGRTTLIRSQRHLQSCPRGGERALKVLHTAVCQIGQTRHLLSLLRG